MTVSLFRSIVVAIDNAPVSDRAFQKAMRMAKALNARLSIVHVLSDSDPDRPRPLHSYATPETVRIDEQIRQKFEQEWAEYIRHYESLLRQKVDDALADGIDATSAIVQGAVGPAVCDLANTLAADLIVVGSHQRRGISELLLGSTSNYIMHHAPCSVLVVHPEEKAVDRAEVSEQLEQPTSAMV